MADRYGTNSRSSSLESEEDMSSLLRSLLHNSFTSIPSSPSTSFHGQHKQSLSSPPPTLPPLAIFSQSGFRFREGTFNSGSSVMVQSSTDFNFSDLEESTRNTSDDFGFDCKGTEASEVPVNPAPPCSSKRNRPADFHNLSEKRRRNRINEKIKALQKLIPNSNKTDKASMLDEAIEYLKQLQLQVQGILSSSSSVFSSSFEIISLLLKPKYGGSVRNQLSLFLTRVRRRHVFASSQSSPQFLHFNPLFIIHVLPWPTQAVALISSADAATAGDFLSIRLPIQGEI